MRIINELYQDVEGALNKLVYYTIEDLRELKDPERDALTEAYDLLVQTLSCLNDASRYRRKKEPTPEEVPDVAKWSREAIDFSKVHASYTCEQKGEESAEEIPYDNFNHTYYLGDEAQFMDAFLIAARNKLSNTYELNYDCLTITYFNDDSIVIRKDYKK